MGWKWLGNGCGISNLCSPSRGILGRDFFFVTAPFHKKIIFVCFYIETSLFVMKRPDPWGFARLRAGN